MKEKNGFSKVERRKFCRRDAKLNLPTYLDLDEAF